MAEVILGPPFFSLPSIGLSETNLEHFVLSSRACERELARRNGGNRLNKLKPNHLSTESAARFQALLPYRENCPVQLTGLAEKARQHPLPMAMVVDDIEELEQHILRVYQVAYANYAFGKNRPSFRRGHFPEDCCGPSSRNITVSLMMHGYLNAAYAHVLPWPDHSYAFLPFVLKRPSMNGVICADPTSDQLRGILRKKPRNLVFVRSGTAWKYTAKYEYSRNLFPDSVLFLGLFPKEGVVIDGDRLRDQVSYYFNGCQRYLEQAYSNPVQLVLPSSKNPAPH